MLSTLNRSLEALDMIGGEGDCEEKQIGNLDIVIRVIPGARTTAPAPEDRLRVFDQASGRQRRRNRTHMGSREVASRGWTREELYQRGRAR